MNKRQNYCPDKITININGNCIQSCNHVKNLGVVMDCSMSMSCQIDQLCKSLTFQLRKISSIRHYLTVEVTKTLVTSLILSRLDYCNSLLVGARSKDICRLQSIQNNAARLILNKKRLAHSRPLLYELRWCL